MSLAFLGLFATPFPWANETLENATIMKAEYLIAAREMTAKSFVLLKNERNTLPINTITHPKLAVVGSLADDRPNTLDWWAGDARAQDSITILQGLRNRFLNSEVSVTFTPGCNSVCDSPADFPAVTAAANAADFVVVVVGEIRDVSGEAGSLSNLDLSGHQLDLVKTVHATGKPYVVLLKNGRPLTIEWLAANAPAILVTWHSGTMGGPAVADVLFGDVNPSGKLPMTFPRTIGQVPLYYDYKNTGRPFNVNDRFTSRYMDLPNTPLYPFGFGLSYTTFKIDDLQLNAQNIKVHQTDVFFWLF